MTEGDCLSITLVNDTNQRIGFHAHGVDYTVASDGTPLNRSCVAPGRSRTYVIKAHAPSARPDGTIDPGSAGYWHYHDHCRGTTHGTDGIRRGAFGALIVRRAGDPVPDRKPFVVVMSDPQTINLRKAPNTPIFEANQGERVEFVVIGHGENFHTFHLHGHRWAETRTGAVSSLSEAQTVRLRDNETVGPADSFGFQVIAGEGVGPGAWMYHCHVQSHSDSGMEGLFVVRTPGGEMTEQTRQAVKRWRNHAGH
jgi:FtsP/CotA-like multicopper oxidase with cupredoxin domain